MPKTLICAALLLLMAAGCLASHASAQDRRAAGTSAETPASTRLDDVSARLLAAHNAWRQKVNVPLLAWSEDVAAHAQAWATTLQGEGCEMRHRPDNPYGENLAWASGSPLTPEAMVAIWSGEEPDYTYDTNTCAAGAICGHYTQLVWRATQTVGCGMARCGDREVWVCDYDPPGNWDGEKPY